MLEALRKLELKASQDVGIDISNQDAYYKTVKEILQRKISDTVIKADGIRGEIDSYREKYKNLQSVLSTLQEKNVAERKALTEEQQILEMKQFDLSLQKKQCAELQDRLGQFKCEPKLCDNDVKRLTECRRKLYLYYQTTRIRWDYIAAEDMVKGYITNKSKTEAEPFSFCTDKGPVCEKLWTIMEQVVDSDWKDLEDATEDNKEK